MRARQQLKKIVGPMTFGKALRADRLAEEISQEELGRRVGVTRQAVSQLERGTDLPSLTLVKKFAKVFSMDPDSYLRYVLQDLIRKHGFKGIEVEIKRTA